MGVTGAYKNRKNARKNFEFHLGTPPPLETSAARSHNRLSLDSRAPGIEIHRVWQATAPLKHIGSGKRLHH